MLECLATNLHSLVVNIMYVVSSLFPQPLQMLSLEGDGGVSGKKEGHVSFCTVRVVFVTSLKGYSIRPPAM